MEQTFCVTPAEAGAKLGPYLRRKGFSASFVRSVKYTENGLRCNGARVRTNHLLKAGDAVCVTSPPEQAFSAAPQPMALEVLLETEHTLALYKPAGLVMHPTRSHRGNTLANGYCALMQQRGHTGAIFRPVGRLDGDTSGVVLCAKTAHAAHAAATGMQKQYIALVEGILPMGKGIIEAPIAPRVDSAILQCVSRDGKPSTTHYEVLAGAGGASLVRVEPRTGRTHQIRVHFSHMGHPLVGDALYGGRTTLMQRQALHCMQVRFWEPQHGETTVCAPLPPDMQCAMAALGMPALPLGPPLCRVAK